MLKKFWKFITTKDPAPIRRDKAGNPMPEKPKGFPRNNVRVVMTHGPSADKEKYNFAPGELGFDTDTNTIVAGTGNGSEVVEVTTVVLGPDDGIYLPMPEGYVPLHIGVTYDIMKKRGSW